MNRQHGLRWQRLALSLVVGGIASTARAGEPASKEFDGLRERWVSAMNDLDVPGMAVIVVKGDKVIFTETLGERDPATGDPVTPDTMFYIASCTKSYMAFAVMTLVEEGKISLDDPVKKYLPKFQIADSQLTETLTVRDLLGHIKGLQSNPIVSLDAFSGEITEERFYRWLKEAKAKGEFAYSNLHFTLTGRIVEAVTGKSWKDFLDERLFKPAGMTRTTAYASRMYDDKDCALPCAVEGGKIVATRVRKTDRTMHAAGGLGSSINDIGRWLILNIGQGSIDGRKILSAAGTKGMWREHSAVTPPLSRGGRTRDGYALGWALGAFQGKRMVEHGGGYTGASAFISFLPEEKLGVAVVINSNGPLADLAAADVYDRLLGTKSADELPKLAKSNQEWRMRVKRRETSFAQQPVTADRVSAPLNLVVGTYENNDWGTVILEVKDGRLGARWGDLDFRLRSTAKDEFDADSGTGDPDKARLEVKAGRVEAVVIQVDAGEKLEARFTPKIGS